MAKFKHNQRVRLAKTLVYGTVTDVFDDNQASRYTVQLETRQAEFNQSELRYTYAHLLSLSIHYLFLTPGKPGQIRAAVSWFALGVLAGYLL